jgi:hypothetical protein
LLVRKEVVVVLPTEVFPKASPGLHVLGAVTSAAASIPGLAVGKECYKLDMEAAVAAKIQLEAAMVT